MKESYVNLINIRRMVFEEIARIAYEDEDLSVLLNSSYEALPSEVASYRDSIYRERSIFEERIRFAMGLSARPSSRYSQVTDGMDEYNIDKRKFKEPLVEVIPAACEACPEKTHSVTNNCRKCIAHPCINVCPVNAISLGDKTAIIDKDKCVNCGRCRDTCPYHAIIQTGRPCAEACGVDAIESDYLDRATINDEKCVSCGRCVVQCPFGAISDKSEIYQLIKAIQSDRRVYAIVAPSFVGQFGPLASPNQIFEGIKQLGFEDVVEVSLGADLTTVNEAKEFLDHVPEEKPFLATSCCYSWALMVEKNFPDQYPMISDSSTPMVYTANYILDEDPEAIICFIGPCISKKLEAMKDDNQEKIHFVITFEELMGMFSAKNIQLSDIETDRILNDGSDLGRGYAIAGGVAEAVKTACNELEPDRDIHIERASGLSECHKLMKQASLGLKDGYLLEGMACQGGCIAGPGTLASTTRVKKSLKKFMDESKVILIED